MAYWQHRAIHKEAWDYFLNRTEADFFLFQEGSPTEDMQDDEKMIWREIGGRRDWGSGIYSPTYKLVEERITTGFTGEFAIGNAKVNDQELTLISLYGLMESDGPTKGYSIPNLHRMLSDLTGLFNGHIGKKKHHHGWRFECEYAIGPDSTQQIPRNSFRPNPRFWAT